MTISSRDTKFRSGPKIDDDFYYLKRFSKKKRFFKTSVKFLLNISVIWFNLTPHCNFCQYRVAMDRPQSVVIFL